MRIEGDTAWPGSAKNFGGEAGIGAANFDGLELRIPFGLNLNLHRHAEKVEILFYPAIEAEAGFGSIHGVGNVEFGNAGRVDPLREKRLDVGWYSLLRFRGLAARRCCIS